MDGRGDELIIEISQDEMSGGRKRKCGKKRIVLVASLFLVIGAVVAAAKLGEDLKKKESNENSTNLTATTEQALKNGQKIRRTLVDGKVIEEILTGGDKKEQTETKTAGETDGKKEESESSKKNEAVNEGAIDADKKEVGEKTETTQTYYPPNGAKIVYLTFDDGPSYNTPKVLDILKKYQIKATFFVMCGGDDAMIKRAYDEGHTIGLHTCTHNYAEIYQNEKVFFEDLVKIEKRVERITGEKMKLIRFPGGSSNTVSRLYNKGIMSRLVQQVEERGYRYVDWNVTSGDAGNTTNTNVVYNNVVSGLRGDYSIVLQHDGKGKDFSVNAVERIIQFGKQYGFTFKRLELNSPTAPHRILN